MLDESILTSEPTFPITALHPIEEAFNGTAYDGNDVTELWLHLQDPAQEVLAKRTLEFG